MSEELTQDPVLDKLTRFTPMVANRDQLLFDAGRASARGSSGWKWLSGGLLLSHALWLLVWLWPSPSLEVLPPGPANPSPPAAVTPPSQTELEETESSYPSPPANSYLAIRLQLSAGKIDELEPPANPDPLPSGMPWRASSRLYLLD